MRTPLWAFLVIGLSQLVDEPVVPARSLVSVDSGLSCPDLEKRALRESRLLHQRLGRKLFESLRIWDDERREWASLPTGAVSRERPAVTVMHLWAEYCAPCTKELYLFRHFQKHTGDRYGTRVRYLFISESASLVDLDRFLRVNQLILPRAPQYHDTGGVLIRTLSSEITESLPLPVTLILDESRVVRQALVGSLEGREEELLGAVDRLLLSQETEPPL